MTTCTVSPNISFSVDHNLLWQQKPRSALSRWVGGVTHSQRTTGSHTGTVSMRVSFVLRSAEVCCDGKCKLIFLAIGTIFNLWDWTGWLGGVKKPSTPWSSRAVPQPSTDLALSRLASEFGRDPAHSIQYGRRLTRRKLHNLYSIHYRPNQVVYESKIMVTVAVVINMCHFSTYVEH